MDGIQTDILKTTVGTLHGTEDGGMGEDHSRWDPPREASRVGGIGPASRHTRFLSSRACREANSAQASTTRLGCDGVAKDAGKGRRIENIRAYPTPPNPTWPDPTRPNPTQPNPAQPKPTQPSPAQSNPTQLIQGAPAANATAQGTDVFASCSSRTPP